MDKLGKFDQGRKRDGINKQYEELKKKSYALIFKYLRKSEYLHANKFENFDEKDIFLQKKTS